MKKFLVLVFGIIILASISKRKLDVTIYHFNDSHAHIDASDINIKAFNEIYKIKAGGYSAFASLTKNRPEYSLFLNGGDVFQGTFYFNKFKGQADAEILNAMKLDAMAVGNHEFDEGAKALTDFAKKANFDLLTANIDIENLPGLKPYKIFKMGAHKIAVVGATTPSANVKPSKAEIYPPVPKLKSLIEDNLIKKQRINKIIVLSHCGYELDKKIAQSIEGIDLIVGGHSHTLLGDFTEIGLQSQGKYPTVIKKENEEVLIVQAASNSLVLGEIDIQFNRRGKITKFDGKPVIPVLEIYKDNKIVTRKTLLDSLFSLKTLQKVEPYEKVDNVILEFSKQIENYKNEVVCELKKSLLHVRIPGWDHPNGTKMPNGSEVAPVICDAFIDAAKTAGYKVDAAIENAGGIRQDLKKGKLTTADIYKCLPYENEVYIIEIDGKNLIEALDFAFNLVITKQRSGHWLYARNLKYNYSKKGLSNYKIKQKNEWKDVEKNKVYSIALNSYIANNFTPFTKAKKIHKTSITDASALSRYLKKYENK